MAGIICIETEWQITKKRNRLTLNSEHLLHFISEMYNVPYIYRRVATRSELLFYLRQFQKTEYNKYNVLYFSFHGDTHSIYLEGENKEITLEELAEMGGNVFADRLVHFSSCRTFLGNSQVADMFKHQSNAKYVSGYRKTVPADVSAIHDIALIGTYLNCKRPALAFKKVCNQFKELQSQLGFVYI